MEDEFFDDDGYPTNKSLSIIEKWSIDTNRKCIELLEFCMKMWKYDEYVSKEKGKYFFSTGGWSGNESIIHAMESNRMFWNSVWYSSRRGGHYEFSLREQRSVK